MSGSEVLPGLELIQKSSYPVDPGPKSISSIYEGKGGTKLRLYSLGDCPDDRCSPTSSLPSGKGRQRKTGHRRGDGGVTLEKGQPVAGTRSVSRHTELAEGNAQPCRRLELKQATLAIDLRHPNRERMTSDLCKSSVKGAAALRNTRAKWVAW